MFRFEYTKNAAKDLRQMNQQVAKRILKKMDFFSKQEDPLKFAKKTKGLQPGRIPLQNW